MISTGGTLAAQRDDGEDGMASGPGRHPGLQDVTELARVLLRPREPLAPGTPAAQAVRNFRDQPDMQSLPVVAADGVPRGLLDRYDLLNRFASPYGHSLYAERPVDELVAPDGIIVDESVTLEHLSERVTAQQAGRVNEDFIIVDTGGRYRGIGTVLDLLRRITDLRLQSARHANPLSGLPGNVPFSRRVEQLLRNGHSFVAIYCDIDHFKTYNDHYGYARGDELIQVVAALLEEGFDGPDDLVAHIGGDDFAIATGRDDWHARAEAVGQRFDAHAPGHYHAADRRRGGIEATDRTGRRIFHPLASLSIAAVHATPDRFTSCHAVATRLAEVKTAAKRRDGSVVVIDRRR
jgi:diguanylate cyclase (GGDEF)-like protein